MAVTLNGQRDVFILSRWQSRSKLSGGEATNNRRLGRQRFAADGRRLDSDGDWVG
jgi:hypothetical protein